MKLSADQLKSTSVTLTILKWAWVVIIGTVGGTACVYLALNILHTEVVLPTRGNIAFKQLSLKSMVTLHRTNCVTTGTPTIESGPLTGEGRTLALSIAYHMRNSTQHPRLFTFYCAIFKVVGVKFPYTPSAVSKVIVDGDSSERGVVVIKWPKKMYRSSVLRRYVYTCACQHTRTMGERVIDMKFVSVPEEVK